MSHVLKSLPSLFLRSVRQMTLLLGFFCRLPASNASGNRHHWSFPTCTFISSAGLKPTATALASPSASLWGSLGAHSTKAFLLRFLRKADNSIRSAHEWNFVLISLFKAEPFSLL